MTGYTKVAAKANQPERERSQPTAHGRQSAEPAQSLLSLQQAAGNLALQRLLREGATDHHALIFNDARSMPPVVQSVLNSSRGQPLNTDARAFMEARFGADFSQVRVHTDQRAAESALAVGARAYTVGQNVVFGAGRYAPTTGEGRRLLAHELAHVVQQTQQTGVSASMTAAEHEAARVGGQAAEGQSAVVRAVATGLQRDKTGAGGATQYSGAKGGPGFREQPKAPPPKEESFSELKERIYSALIEKLRSAQKQAFDSLQSRASNLPPPLLDDFIILVRICDSIIDALINFIIAVVAFGFGATEGIISLIEALISFMYFLIKYLTLFLLTCLDNGQKFGQYNKEIIEAVLVIPESLRALLDDWLKKYKTAASPDHQLIMIGELLGQIAIIMATFETSVAKIGKIPKFPVPKLVFEAVPVQAGAGVAAMRVRFLQPVTIPGVAGGVGVLAVGTLGVGGVPTLGAPPAATGGSGSGSYTAPPKPKVSGGARPETAGSGGIASIDRTFDKVTGVSQTVIEGRLQPTLPRAHLEELLGPNLPNADRAHLWGPIFGDEAAAGILYAPSKFNRSVQLTLEKTLRLIQQEAKAAGGHVWLRASNRSHPKTVLGGRALKEVKYEFQIRLNDGRTSKIIRVEFDNIVEPGTLVTKRRPGFTISTPFE